jgi:hypothetical protein
VTERGTTGWPPPREASLLDVLLASVFRLESIGVTPWNMWVEPGRRVMVTLAERPSDSELDQLIAALEPLHAEPHWFEAVTEDGADTDDDDNDDDLDREPPESCSLCGGPGPLRQRSLAPSAQSGGGWAIASTWHLCSACLATIATADAEAVKSRMRLEDQTAPYADVLAVRLVQGLQQ